MTATPNQKPTVTIYYSQDESGALLGARATVDIAGRVEEVTPEISDDPITTVTTAWAVMAAVLGADVVGEVVLLRPKPVGGREVNTGAARTGRKEQAVLRAARDGRLVYTDGGLTWLRARTSPVMPAIDVSEVVAALSSEPPLLELGGRDGAWLRRWRLTEAGAAVAPSLIATPATGVVSGAEFVGFHQED